jgi:hypothetical protein
VGRTCVISKTKFDFGHEGVMGNIGYSKLVSGPSKRNLLRLIPIWKLVITLVDINLRLHL